MATIVLRAGKGSPLTNAEVDANFSNINSELAGKLTANQNITVSGDATGSGATAITLTLANSGATAGTYGNSTNIPQITVDAKGRITLVSNVAVSIPSGSLTFTGDVTGSGSTGSTTTLTLAASGVTAGTYTKITVDAKGRATAGAALASSDVTTALGYTPYNSTNPSGYITSSALSSYLPLAGGTLTGTLNVNFSNASYSTPVSYSNTAAGGGAHSVLLFASALGNAVAGDSMITNSVGNMIISPNAAGKALKLVGGVWTNPVGITITESGVDLRSGATINSSVVLHASNYTSYSPSLTGTGASGTWGISITGSANAAAHLLPTYIGGAQPNPQAYFGSAIGVKVAMTAKAGFWSDTLWINGYAGGDVLPMCALHFQRDGTPRGYISSQNSDATAYGTLYELLSAYNYSSYALPIGGGNIPTNGYIDFGPNSSWGATLRVGGNGHGGTSRASVVTTDGNLHLDGTAGHGIYLNYYTNGPIYATSSLYTVLHSGNISSYAMAAMANGTTIELNQTITSDYTVSSGKNALSVGPLTVNTGVTVTVPSGSVWTIV